MCVRLLLALHYSRQVEPHIVTATPVTIASRLGNLRKHQRRPTALKPEKPKFPQIHTFVRLPIHAQSRGTSPKAVTHVANQYSLFPDLLKPTFHIYFLTPSTPSIASRVSQFPRPKVTATLGARCTGGRERVEVFSVDFLGKFSKLFALSLFSGDVPGRVWPARA